MAHEGPLLALEQRPRELFSFLGVLDNVAIVLHSAFDPP